MPVRRRMGGNNNQDMDALRAEIAALRRGQFEESHHASLIPSFSGDVENLSTFLDRFDVISSAYDWKDKEKCQRFPLYLSGHARDVYRNITEQRRANFDDMITDFKSGMNTNITAKMFGCQLRARKQMANESAAEYASRLRELAKKAYPTLQEDQRALILRDCFLFGIRPYLQTRLLDKEVDTFEEAIKTANNLEIRYRYFQPENDAPVYSVYEKTGQTEMEQKLSQLSTEIQQIKNNRQLPKVDSPPFQRTRVNEQGQPFCTLCRRHGHTEPVCYHRQQQRYQTQSTFSAYRPGTPTNKNVQFNTPRQFPTTPPNGGYRQSPPWRQTNFNSGQKQDPRIPNWRQSNQPPWRNRPPQQYNQQIRQNSGSQQPYKGVYAIHQQDMQNRETEQEYTESCQASPQMAETNQYIYDLETEIKELSTKLERLSTDTVSKHMSLIRPAELLTATATIVREDTNSLADEHGEAVKAAEDDEKEKNPNRENSTQRVNHYKRRKVKRKNSQGTKNIEEGALTLESLDDTVRNQGEMVEEKVDEVMDSSAVKEKGTTLSTTAVGKYGKRKMIPVAEECRGMETSPAVKEHGEMGVMAAAKMFGRSMMAAAEKLDKLLIVTSHEKHGGILGAFWVKWLVLLVLLLMSADTTRAIQAFDCEKPSISDQISLLDVEACPEATPTRIQQTVRMYHLYQETMTRQIMVTECRLQVAELIFHCGLYSHSTLTKMQITPETITLTMEQCRDAKRFGQITIDKRTISAKMNKTVTTKTFIAGQITANGECKGGKVLVNGGEFDHMVHYKEYVVTTTSYLALFDLQTKSMLTNGYGYCKYTDENCDTGQSILVYEAPPETCELVFLKSVELIEVKGQQVHYSTRNKETADLRDTTFSENTAYKDTPVVLMTRPSQETIRLIRKSDAVRCQMKVFTTNYDYLYVSTEPILTAKAGPAPTDIRLTLFLTNKMDYLYHANLAAIEDVYRDTIQRDCKIEREVLRTKLALAIANPEVATPLLSSQAGIYGRVTGEALLIFKCSPVDVQPRESLECTKQLPVTYMDKAVYMEPISRIITTKPVKVECSAIVTPRFRMANNLWISSPHRTKAETPRTLSVMSSKEDLKFNSFDELDKNGIYSKEDLEKARNYIMFPQLRTRILTEIVQQSTQGFDSSANYELLLSPDHFKKAAENILKETWGRFMFFGQFVSGVIGVYTCIALIKVVLTQTLSGYHLYRLLGCSWRILIGCFPFLAKFYIFHKHEQRLRQIQIDRTPNDELPPPPPDFADDPPEDPSSIYQTPRPPGRPAWLEQKMKRHKRTKSVCFIESKAERGQTDEYRWTPDQIASAPPSPQTRTSLPAEGEASSSILAGEEIPSIWMPPPMPLINHQLHLLFPQGRLPPPMPPPQPPPEKAATFQVYPTISTIYLSEDTTPLMDVEINGIPISALVDTGSMISLISEAVADKCGGTTELSTTMMKSITGHLLELIGEKSVQLCVGTKKWSQNMKILKHCPFQAILGMDSLKQLGLENIFTRPLATRKKNAAKAAELNSEFVTVAKSMTIPPRSEIVFEGKILYSGEKEVIFEPLSTMMEKYDTPTSSVLCYVRNKAVPVRMVNFSQEEKLLPAGLRLGTITEVKGITNLIEESDETQMNPDLSVMAQWRNKLPIREAVQLTVLLRKYEDIFAKSEFDLGHTAVVKHAIPVESDTPIRQRPYRTPHRLQQEGERQIKEMLHHNVIRHSVSPWSSPVVMVAKKDGSTRFCVDYRKLNQITVKDTYPLPRIDDMLDKLGKSEYFSTLDLASGYWQIEVKEEDREKTAFTTGAGLFEFNVLPFGLTGAPSTFQRTMDFILMDTPHSMVYIDDVIVFSENFGQHLIDLENVFKRIRQANLKLKPQKCTWGKPEVKFLGHVISRNGIKPDPENTEKVQSFPIPKTVKHIQQFLGLASYYRRFIKDFAKTAEPLHKLLKKSEKFLWTEKHQEAFEVLKGKLTSPPIMTFPRFDKPFLLQTDASGHSLGAVLGQINEDGAETVVAYASRTLKAAERAYSVIERELLAIIWGVRFWRHYLYGQKIHLQTDHAPLRWLMSHKDQSSRLIRWALQLQEYDIQIEYKPGKSNKNADALSRIPEETVMATIFQAVPQTEAMKLHQKEDEEIQIIRKYVTDGQLPDEEIHKRLRMHLKMSGSRYGVKDDLLYVNSGFHGQILVLPRKFREQILLTFHDGAFAGHVSAPKVYARLRPKYFWPTMLQDVTNWCKSCQLCAARKRPKKYIKAPLKPIVVDGPFSILAMDILELPKTTAGNRYILVCVDYLTKWPECFPLSDQKADTIARILVEEVIARHGAPRKILTDRGANFMSEVIAEVTKIFNIHKISTSPYHPQCDGVAERLNSSLIKMLSCYTASSQTDWDIHLPYILMAYRTSEHSTTKHSPFLLMYGREPYMPIDFTFQTQPIMYMDNPTYKDFLPKFLEQAWAAAKQNIVEAQEDYRQRYDRSATPHQFNVGDKVLVHTPQPKKGISPKLQRLWQGPYQVEDVTPQNVRVSSPKKPTAPLKWLHVNRLKRSPPSFTLMGPEDITFEKPVPQIQTKTVAESENHETTEMADQELREYEMDEEWNIPAIHLKEGETPPLERWEREVEENALDLQQEEKNNEQTTTPPPEENVGLQNPLPVPIEQPFFSLRSRKIPKMLALIAMISIFTVLPGEAWIKVEPEVAIIRLNASIELRCATNLKNYDTIEWIHVTESHERIYTETSQNNESSLFFLRFTEANQGNYTCVKRTRNQASELATATALLEIPTDSCNCQTIELKEYLGLRINCYLGKGRTNEIPRWKIGGKTLYVMRPRAITQVNNDRIILLLVTGPAKGQMVITKRPYFDPYLDTDQTFYQYLEPTTSKNSKIKYRRPLRIRRSLGNLMSNLYMYYVDVSLIITLTKETSTRIQLYTEHCTKEFTYLPEPPKKTWQCQTICNRRSNQTENDVMIELSQATRMEYSKWMTANALLIGAVIGYQH
jgi:hypothetical protein